MHDQNEIGEQLTGKKSNQFLYISLYGLSSGSDIDDQIFQQLHPILASKGVAVAGKIAKGLINLGLKINLDSDGALQATADSKIPEVPLKPFISDFKKRVLIFDDLERCNMPIELVLGYINSFVEHQGSKVIIVANDDEIEAGLIDNEQKEDSKYHRIKEKVIGKSFVVESDSVLVMQSLIEECTEQAKKFMQELKNLCLEVFYIVEKSTGKRNYRAFGHVLRDLEYLWPRIIEHKQA
jgi:hypothetical protein